MASYFLMLLILGFFYCLVSNLNKKRYFTPMLFLDCFNVFKPQALFTDIMWKLFSCCHVERYSPV